MKYLKTYENFWDIYAPSGRYLEMEILKNGDLKISLTDDGILEVDETGISIDNFYDYFDDIRANSEYLYFEDLGKAGIGLTDSPGITDGYYYDDDGELTDEEHDDSSIYWYPNYIVKDFTEDLMENGYVIFNTINPKTPEEIEKAQIKWDSKKYNL